MTPLTEAESILFNGDIGRRLCNGSRQESLSSRLSHRRCSQRERLGKVLLACGQVIQVGRVPF